MALDGALGEEQPAPDLPVGEPRHEKAEDLLLAM